MDDIFRSLTSGLNFKSRTNQIAQTQFKPTTQTKATNDSLMEALTGKKEQKKIKRSNIELAIESNNTNEENINYIRNQLNIRVKGDEVPGPSLTFDNMNINQEIKEIILNNIEASDWKEPTPIQMQAIPSLLLKRDVLASAPTGSGKTAAFVIPMLSYISSSSSSSSASATRGIKGLILVPTKELGEQILSDTLRLSEGRKIKAKTLKKAHMSLTIEQEKKMYNSIDILISTPMRLLGALLRKAVDLSAGKPQLQIVVTTTLNNVLITFCFYYSQWRWWCWMRSTSCSNTTPAPLLPPPLPMRRTIVTQKAVVVTMRRSTVTAAIGPL